MASSTLMRVDFEIFGTVQGVFFRKYTHKKANELNLKGYCINTDHATVSGVLEGELSNINEMKKWLQNSGSPLSKIEKSVFKNEQPITAVSYKSFEIR